MDNQERITKPEHKLPTDLWQQLDSIDDSNIEKLIESLEKYVSNGFFGAAAELSDSLESYPGLDKNLNWKMRVEQERMKRYYCLGFEKLTIASSNRVLNYLENIRIATDKYFISKGTAIGHKGWITLSTNELKSIIDACKDIRDKVQNQQDKDERTCFIYALEGRLHHLQGDHTKANKFFEKAIGMAEAEHNRFLRSAAHIKIIYAEHLALQKKWEKVVGYASEFLLNAAQLQFKTHLLIRAFILLLQAPSEYLKNTEKDFQHYVFRYQILLHAMGLSQSQELNPILAKAKKIIPGNKFIDLYYVDWRTELKRRILEIAKDTAEERGRQFEKLIMLLYQLRDYQVFDLPTNFEAIDFIAMFSSPDGVNSFIAVQVKSGKDIIRKKDIAGYNGKLLNAKQYLESGIYTDGNKIEHVSIFHWYSIKKIEVHAYQELVETVKNCLGKECKFNTTYFDELVEKLLNISEILLRLFFSKDFDIK